MAEEALESLTKLLESVPTWIQNLEHILQTSTERQKEILFENQPAGTPVQLSRKPSKSSSLLSKPSSGSEREQLNDGIPPAQTKKGGELLRSQLPHMTQSDKLRLVQRKRKTASALSDLSGPPRFRSKAAVVIYYDGETQKQFETVVRAIAANRNAIRKSKVVAKVERVSRAGSGSSSEASSNREQVPTRSSKFSYVSTRAVPEKDDAVKDSTALAFEQLDDLMDKAQALCEKAAHQVLRDGDCALELRQAREHVAELEQVGGQELPTLQKRAEKARECQQRARDRDKAERDKTEAAKSRSTPESGDEKLENPFSTSGSLDVDLEPDDSDEDEDIGFEVGALQLGKYGFKNTRSPAIGAA